MGKEIRMSKILDPAGPPAMIAKADQGLAVGPISGLEDIEAGLKAVIAAGIDGVVLGPGQAGREAHLFRGKRAPALLVRSDWSNVARCEGFPLPRKRMVHVGVAGAKDATFLGAHGMVASFYVGYRDDEDEADNLEAISKLGEECCQYGLPLMVEALPVGERITEHNYLDSLKMAGRMSLEAGADGIIVPYAGAGSSMREVVEAAGGAPVLLLQENSLDAMAVSESVKVGVRGVVVGDVAFGQAGEASIRELARLLGRGV